MKIEDEPVNGARFILDAIKREGVDHVFLVPGGLIDATFRRAKSESL